MDGQANFYFSSSPNCLLLSRVVVEFFLNSVNLKAKQSKYIDIDSCH